MKMKYRKTFLAFSLALCVPLSACSSEKEPEKQEEETAAEPTLADCEIEHEPEFGGVYIKATIDDFNKLGFVYGDSVNVEFSNGYKLEDIPYYNGYYVDAGEPLLIAYPGYDYIKAAINYGEDLWEKAHLQSGLLQAPVRLFQAAQLSEHDTATVTLNERGKYLDVQEARDINYSDLREEYPSDVVFANFRNFYMGDITEGVLYRSASPCDNQHKRAPYVDRLIEEAGVGFILNLSDNDAKIEKYIGQDDFDSPYFLSLYENGNVEPIALNMNYLSDEFAQKIAEGFKVMAKHEGPYLIHCTEGKDRTGFVCMLIEALAGADYQSIVDDYMLTYDNYYKINEVKDPAKYKTIKEKNVDAMLKFVAGDPDVDITAADLSEYAKNYLRKAGMSDEEIAQFLLRINGAELSS